MRKLTIISLIVIAVLFFSGFYFYTILPDTVITHWNAAGQPNGYMSKLWGAFLLPIITLGLFFLLAFLPRLDPMEKNYEKFIDYYNSFIFMFVLFMSYVYVITILWNLDIKIPIILALLPALGLLFIYIGIILRHVKQNWFIGIRTPWTLSNENVWNKTHLFGSNLFIISGGVIIIGLLFPSIYQMWFIIIPIVVSVVWVFVYSYLVYRKEMKK